jgi:Ras-related protein Rab-24
MSRIYYRGAKAAIVCYDLTDSASFERAKFWVNELKTSEEDCNVYLCGTKCDIVEENKMARDVDKRVVEEYREEIGAKDNMETSAKTGHNVVELFTKIAEDYVEAMKRESAKPDEDKVDLTLQRPGTHKKKSGCSCN